MKQNSSGNAAIARAVASIASLEPYDPKTHGLHVMIETPRGCRNKYRFDPATNLFQLDKILPAGMAFPFDFGYVPATLAEDGDPLDAMVLGQEALFTGCLVVAVVVGVIEATQEENGKKVRNDRILTVPEAGPLRPKMSEISGVLRDIEHFFQCYHALEGTRFEPIGRHGPRHAAELVERARRRQRAQSQRGQAASRDHGASRDADGAAHQGSHRTPS
jgi:inorganic pyrophosphatase